MSEEKPKGYLNLFLRQGTVIVLPTDPSEINFPGYLALAAANGYFSHPKVAFWVRYEDVLFVHFALADTDEIKVTTPEEVSNSGGRLN